jgi:hypothetical protein
VSSRIASSASFRSVRSNSGLRSRSGAASSRAVHELEWRTTGRVTTRYSGRGASLLHQPVPFGQQGWPVVRWTYWRNSWSRRSSAGYP